MGLSRYIPTKWKQWVRPWVPPALVDLYRRRRAAPTLLVQPGAEFLLSARGLAELFPGSAIQDVRMPISQIGSHDHMVAPPAELLALAAVCRYIQPLRIFEIGTYTGVSTLIMAMNTPPEAEIFTLDVDPAERATHRTGLGVGAFTDFSVGSAYRGTPSGAKIRQLFGSSLTFDYSSFSGSIDLVFVDADHTYEFVKRDTETAFRLLRPGGVIIWDDYLWDARFPECAGVTRCLNELAQTRPVVRLDGTRLAIYVDREDRPAAARASAEAGRV